MIRIKYAFDGNIEYKLVKQSVKDIGVDDLEEKLKPLIDEFAIKFK